MLKLCQTIWFHAYYCHRIVGKHLNYKCFYTYTVPPEMTQPAKDFQLPFNFPPPHVREPEPPKYYLCDGVMVTQHAKRQIEKIVVEPPKIRRTRRWSKKPEGWDEEREEEQKIERKMQEIMEGRKQTTDGESVSAAPALTRLLSVGSDKDDDKGEGVY